jgi:excisionase family DNA binding protein
MEPLAVDIREAGRLTSLSPRTIRRYIKSGRIRAVRVGRRLLVPIDALRSVINQNSSRQNEMVLTR